MMGQKFSELVKMGDFLEEGIRFRKVQSMVVPFNQSREPSRNNPYSKNPQISTHHIYTPTYHVQPHYNPPRTTTYENPQRPYVPIQVPIHQNRPAYAPRPHLKFEATNIQNYTPIAEPLAQLFERLKRARQLHLIVGKITDPLPMKFNENDVVLFT